MANNQAKSVIIFATAYLPLVGGAEIAVDEITKKLPDWQFDLITAKIKPGLKKEERINNVNIYRLGRGSRLDKFLLPLSGFLKAVRLNKKRKYSIIWSLMASQASIGAVFFKIFYPSKRLLLNIQEGDPEDYLKRYVLDIDFLYKVLIRPWHLLSLRKADYITALSLALKRRVLLSGARAPIEIVPNGVDIEKFKVQSSKFKVIGQKLKLKLGIKENEKVIITISRLVKKNGIDDLVKAIQELTCPPRYAKCCGRGIKNQSARLATRSVAGGELRIKLLIIGSGQDEKKLKDLVKKLDLENSILFLGGILHQDLPQYLALADVFVRPSLSEGLGNVFLEAMAAGLPIIGTPVGGILDFLKDGETGLFCRIKNPKSIAEKIKEILSDDRLREKLIQNGQKLAEEKYSWDIIARQMEKIFKKI